ncbi:metallophosphoesterase [Bacillus sp. CECT 9360]|uniref:metallophosphoesterase family protein n=1 Tax=Bacillus sp. CECT 9360 TaxID=2845821 RepID=UPI001E65113E|nr:metallophosphoesterase [Bacillus sp. CECT 9360]CAH0344035.1 3',5'-cyclic adenosine monophosphate phosphodiesterase CpdA [Bacillus sp. CECT 9360]
MSISRIVSLAVILLFATGPVSSSSNVNEPFEKDVPVLQFPVISDVHICGQPRTIEGVRICEAETDGKFLEALEDIERIAPGYKAIAIVGDFTNQGLDEQYDRFMDLLFTGTNPGAEKIIAIGNHEFFENKHWKRPMLTNQMLVKRYSTKTGMGNVYYDRWIEGYHFITLGSESMFRGNPNKPFISDAQYKWLEQTLSDNAATGKPIFVFLHQPIKHTVYGTEGNYADFEGTRLKKILSKYPQTVLFSGHSHYDLNHPKTVYRQGFTMVNTSSISYVMDKKGRKKHLSQGILVEVYKDRLEIKAREFSNSSWIRAYSIPLKKKSK